jgi:alpha(1,3/1,4) fucosyltransferase
VLMECPVILPHNWDAARHAQFQKLFTWHGPIVDGERYVKLNFPNHLPVPERLDVEAAVRNLCAIVAGNKHAAHPLELYSARRAAIRWFEARHPEHFDLYGKGWEAQAPGLPPAQFARYPSWRGAVERKHETLSGYWFSICFENARDIPGYITEKVFDCLLARTVPVYWGASDIAEHLPADAFVDMRRFASFDELYAHLTAMEPDEYAAYLEGARRFLAGPQARPFSNEGCVEVLARELARS